MLENLGTNLERIQTQIIQEFGQSDVLHEEASIQVFSQSGMSHEGFDTESLDPPPTNEREAKGIYTWSQEASDNLGKLAADAAKAAQKNPGQWVNPLKSYLLSRIRYAQTPSQIRQLFLEAILDEKTFKEKLHEYNSGYYQIDYPKMNMLLIRVPESVAISALKESWYEEIYEIQDKRYGEVIRLIKRMGGLQTDKIRAIKSRRCFTELSPLPGLKRFVSADRRFPVSVCYPRELGFVYHFSDERNLYVDWSVSEGSLGISRENFGMSAQNGNVGARLVLQGKEAISQFMLHDFTWREAQAIMVGIGQTLHKPWLENKIVGEKEQPIEAKRLVWQTPSGQYAGEWVFFLRARQAGIWSFYTNFKPRVLYVLPELWTIYNSFLGEEDFNTFLSSFRWLSVDFFRSLPALP